MSSTVIDRENALKILRDSNPFQEFCKIWDAQKNQTERCQKDLILENEQEEVFIPKKNSKWANYKVKLCDEFKQNSECSKGDLCFYAHSIDEMRFKDSPILIRVKNMHEHSKLIKIAKPFIIANTQKYTLDSSNNDYVNSKRIHFNCILENSKLQEDLKQLKNHNEILNNQNLNLNNIIKDLKTEIEWYENEIQTKKILSLESQVKEQTDQIKKLTDEVDHKRLQIISLLHKNSELTEKISKEEQQISNGKANKSKAKKDLKDLNKKIEVLSKTNKELKTSYNNQTMISNLYLEDCKALQNEVQHYIKEIKALKDLMDKDQSKETNCKDIVIINQNDDFSYKSNYCDLISQLKDLFECPLSLDRLKNPIILPSGFTIEEEYFDRLVDSKDPYNKEFIVKHKTQNRFARQVKEIVEVSEDEMLKQQQSYQEIKAQLEIDRENCCKSVQTDFVVRAEEDIITIKQLTKLIEDYKLDGHRNQQIVQASHSPYFWRVGSQV